MEKLNFNIDNKSIVELLGQQNFSTKESALFELVKNAYDARAQNLQVSIELDEEGKQVMIISDDGDGMSLEDIKAKWMSVGKSEKEYNIPNSKRIYAGSKGIGKFALARLGGKILLTSKKNNCNAIKWESDWEENIISELSIYNSKGTRIVIKKLREIWTKKDIKELQEFLSRVYRTFDMKIVIDFIGDQETVAPILSTVTVGLNCLTKVSFTYDSKNLNLNISIISDEFQDEVADICTNVNINNQEFNIDVADENLVDDDYLDKKEIYHKLGSFSGDFYFVIRSTSAHAQRFKYKYERIAEPIKTGIILYRNDFSVSSYEGKTDWLQLDERARRSPAAATHLTGAWRVRFNQLHGEINIDKNSNPHLQDLSNRQSLVNDEYYEAFINIIYLVLKQFEKYRQGIIKRIDSEAQIMNEKEQKLYKKILLDPKKIEELDKDQRDQFVKEIKSIISYSEEIEGKYIYDSRILNTLATMGLKAATKAHDLKNKRDNINTVEYIEKALKIYGFWDTLNEKDKTDVASRNIPYLLNKSESSARDIIGFLNELLKNIEKKHFLPQNNNVYTIITEITNSWNSDYNWLNFEIDGDRTGEFILSQDILRVIFDNLILNSKEQNEQLNNLTIKISFDIFEEQIFFRYSDNGQGLNKKYKNNPYRILEVHESTRESGHGLGMWIVNNSVLSTSGKITSIGSDAGFQFNFQIGGVR